MKSRKSNLLNQSAIVACLFGGASLLAGGAIAQSEGGDAEEDATARLGTITVTAQKREQDLQDVPVSVVAYGQEQLENNQFSDSRALTTIAPSVNFQTGFTPAATNFNIRGIGSFAFVAGVQPSTSMVVDEVPLARNGEFVFDLADIQQIEVLRGPQGTLFGRGSTGGAINITTAAPTEEFDAQIEVGASTDEEYLIRGFISGPLSDNVRGRLTALYSDRKGYLENLGPEDDLNGQRTAAVRGKLDIDLSQNLTLNLVADYTDIEHGFNPLVGGPFGDDLRNVGGPGVNIDALAAGFGYPTNARAIALGNGDLALGQQILNDPFTVATDLNTDENQNTIWGLSGKFTWDISDSLRFKSITAYREFTNDASNDTDSTPSNLSNPGLFPIITVNASYFPRDNTYGFQDTLEYIQQEFRLEGTADNFNWLVGLFAQDLDETATSGRAYLFDVSQDGRFMLNQPLGSTYACFVCDTADNALEQQTLAVFADATFSLSESLEVFGGVRYTEEEVTKTLNNGSIFTFIPIGTLQAAQDPVTGVVDFSGIAPLAPRPDAVGSVSETFDFVSWRAGANYYLSDDVSAYITATRGWVGPAAPISAFDVLGLATNSPAFVDPTKAENFEVGIKSELFDQRLRLNGALYQTDVTNLQTQAVLPGTINPVTVSGGDLDIMGLELDATFQATDWLTLGASLAYTDAEIKDKIEGCFEDQLTAGTVPGCTIDSNNDGVPDQQDVSGFQTTNTPKFAYNLNAAIDIPASGDFPLDIFGSANWAWRDDIQYELNQDDLSLQEAYGTLDLTLGVRDPDDVWEAFIYGKNVTDEFFFQYAIGIPGFAGRQTFQSLRNSQAYYGAGLKVNF